MTTPTPWVPGTPTPAPGSESWVPVCRSGAVLYYNDPITRTWKPVCGADDPVYGKDPVTGQWIALCCGQFDNVAGPPVSYTLAGTDRLYLPRAVAAGEIAVLVTGTGLDVYGGTTPTGGWATWTKIYDGYANDSSADKDASVFIWLGTGIGAGTTVTIGAGEGGSNRLNAALACYIDVSGTVALRQAAKHSVPPPCPNVVSASHVQAEAGDIVFCVARGFTITYGDPPHAYPDVVSSYVDTGFSGSHARYVNDASGSGNHVGIAISAGSVRSSTLVGTSFPMVVSEANDASAQTVNLSLSVTQ